MKKSLLAVAIAAAVPAVASAQVTVFGIMDGGVNSVVTKTGGTETTVVRTGGNAAGALASNRLGFRGTEKIGSMTAGFHYELGMDAGGTGDLSTTGGVRQSTVSLAGGFGSIQIGRDYTPVFQTAAKFDASAADNVNIGKTVYLTGSAADERITTVRNSGQIAYTTPSMGGLVARLAWHRSEQDPAAATDNASVGGFIGYDAGPISLQAGFNKAESRNADKLVQKRDEMVIGAAYQLNKEIRLMGMWGSLDQNLPNVPTNSAGSRNADYDGYQLGVRWMVTPNMQLHGSYGQGDTKSTITGGSKPGSESRDLTGYKFGLIYSLSNRTRAYGLLGMDELKTKSGLTSTTRERSEFAMGINHSF